MSNHSAFASQLLRYGLGDGLPTLIRDGLTMMQFQVMKMLPAFSCVFSARQRRALRKGAPVIESSSGSIAYGLARVCAATGHPLTIVSADLEPWLESALIALGARVEQVSVKGELARIQRLRLERLHELRRHAPAYWPCQYDNLDTPGGYAPAAELLANCHGVPDVLVCPVGSGGNSAGLANLLRTVNPSMRLVGVDCLGSITFGLPLAERELGGIGNSLMPRCVDHAAFDEVHWVNGPVGIDGARRIQADGFGDFGLTSGAAYVVARWLQHRHPRAQVTVVFPDRGTRYVDRLAQSPCFDTRGLSPATVCALSDAASPWARLLWARHPLSSWVRGKVRQGLQ